MTAIEAIKEVVRTELARYDIKQEIIKEVKAAIRKQVRKYLQRDEFKRLIYEEIERCGK